MSQATATTTAPAIAQPAQSNLSAEQVMRILRTRKIVDHTMAGSFINKGLRIVGQGNKTKDVDNQRLVYNTNAMRRDAMAIAAAHLRNGQQALAIDDNEGAQEAFRQALNIGVLSFSHPVEGWEPFPAGALITAVVSSFTIKAGPDAGKTGIGLDQVRLAPSVALAGDATGWDALLAADLVAEGAVSTPALSNADVIA